VPPSLVGSIASVAEADQLLEGLEQLALTASSDGDFYRHFFMVAQGLTHAQSVSILCPANGEWLIVASSGEVCSNHLVEFAELKRRSPTSFVLEGGKSSGKWVAATIDTRQSESGILLFEYSSDSPSSLIESGRLLLDPFCEIIQTRLEFSRSALDRSWFSRLESAVRSLTSASSPQQVGQSLVDQLVLALEGARASMVNRIELGSNSFRLSCSSGAHGVDRTSPTVKRLEQIAEIASRSTGVLQWSDRSPVRDPDEPAIPVDSGVSNRDSFGVFANGIALTWDRNTDRTPVSWLIIEWSDTVSMNKAIPFLSSWCNSLHGVWLQQDRWTRLPMRLRERFTQSHASMIPRVVRKWIRRLLWISLIAGLLWGLTLPFPMSIESKAILEPVSRRLIHASADGYVAELLVDDGDRVVAQQELARLRSPSLDLQIEEAMGRLRAIAEKRNGLKVAINQLSPNAQDSLANQTRLSTELLMLDSNETQAREMLSFYQAEQARLVLRSPIDGIIVAKQLKQELENRPIRRGDPILQVVDLSGDWQLRIQVADRDSDYVGRYYGERGGKPLEKEIQYSFDSLPSQQFVAAVKDISRVIENRDGTGGFQEVLANVIREDASKVHMGATARVRFACGKEPFGYVWSRPLIEFLQKRFRLFSWQQLSTAAPTTDFR
jgi:multidrug efflux pump subunit AcrA (membrane-fusion protein)